MGPPRCDLAVGRTADRILRDAQLRAEASGYAVECCSPGCCILNSAGETGKKGLRRLHGPYQCFFFKDADQIKAEHRFDRAETEGLLHAVCDRDFPELTGRHVHLIQIPDAMDGQNAAQGLKLNRIRVRFIVIQDHKGRCKGCMSAKLHLGLGRKPPEMISGRLTDDEGCLGQTVFHGQVFHESIRRPAVHDADGSRVSGEGMICKCIDNELFHDFLSPVTGWMTEHTLGCMTRRNIFRPKALYPFGERMATHSVCSIESTMQKAS